MRYKVSALSKGKAASAKLEKQEVITVVADSLNAYAHWQADNEITIIQFFDNNKNWRGKVVSRTLTTQLSLQGQYLIESVL